MMYVLRITCGNSSIVTVYLEGKPPFIFKFDTAYEGLLFERAIGAHLEFITHGNNRLVPMEAQ